MSVETPCYGDDAPSYDIVKRWHGEFKHGLKSVETAIRPGRQSSAIDEASVRQFEAGILDHRRITIRQIAQKSRLLQSLWKLSSFITICIYA